MSEANKNVIRRYVEFFNAGDVEGLRGLCAPDALIQGVLGWGKIDQGDLDLRSIGIATFGAIILLLVGRLVRRRKER